jgi:hypothetical protein
MIDDAVVSGNGARILKKKLAQLKGREMKITDPILNSTYEFRGCQK